MYGRSGLRAVAATVGVVALAGLVVLVPQVVAAIDAAPVNSSPPTITGTAQEGQSLVGHRGTWSGNPTDYNDFWMRCDKDGGSCSNISGANSIGGYVLKSVDVGNTIRLKVQARNADGSTVEVSTPTAVVRAAAATVKAVPRNTTAPTITGVARVGDELTASTGDWSETPDRFEYQWQRCDSNGLGCSDVAGATGKTYGVRLLDKGNRLRVVVTAINSAGSAKATSGLTRIVAPAVSVRRNQRPRLFFFNARMVGPRVYARFRVCDDSRKNLTIVETDRRPGVLSYSRRFSTVQPPRNCGVYTRSWTPAPRFRRDGRYLISLRAIDRSGLSSRTVTRTLFI
jgi:hypothetical protein